MEFLAELNERITTWKETQTFACAFTDMVTLKKRKEKIFENRINFLFFRFQN